jgi:hypothetical protein
MLKFRALLLALNEDVKFEAESRSARPRAADLGDQAWGFSIENEFGK